MHKITKTIRGWTYQSWFNVFHMDKSPYIECQMPAIYKEEDIGMVEVEITIKQKRVSKK